MPKPDRRRLHRMIRRWEQDAHGPEGGGNYEWPNVANPVDGRLRLVVRGPFFPGKTKQSEVLAFQRPV